MEEAVKADLPFSVRCLDYFSNLLAACHCTLLLVALAFRTLSWDLAPIRTLSIAGMIATLPLFAGAVAHSVWCYRQSTE
jgi:hypothetical protein